ncbi:MAG: serine/threonine-protein kinase [Lachnospiraceae bacterium]|nr:serine/threonine-protein kinase [Lachnospiraceae bacterium]MDD3617292.1 serine/threonine-protein kinase [Lachnospiraceae bacterium]
MNNSRSSDLRKEFFFERKYQIIGDAIKDSENSTIYPVQCLCIPNSPTAVLKIYHNRNITTLFKRLQNIHVTSWTEIYDVDYFDEDTYVVEEYVPGITLDKVIHQKKLNHTSFSPQEIETFMTTLCNSINLLHHLNPPIIHRDLKPDNIILVTASMDEDPILDYSNLKIIDFDTIREYNTGQTRDTEFMGTRQYASPEQLGFAALGQTDARSDIYSIGIILYEMIYGKLPSAQNLKELPPRQPFSNIIRKCTQFQPEDRFQSMDELLNVLLNKDSHKTSVTRKEKKPYISFTTLNPMENPLLLPLIIGILFGVGMRYDTILLIANLLFWLCIVTTIILRSHYRGNHPVQFSISSSVVYWILFLLFILIFSIIVGIFFMPLQS